MSTNPAPINQQIIDDTGLTTLPWVLFFNQMFEGDAGTDWSPSFTGLTEVGSATITGRRYSISNYLSYFRVNIIPGTNTSAVSGTTRITNFPLTFLNDGICGVVTGVSNVALGVVDADTQSIYTPTWTNITQPVTIIGLVEAS